MADDVKIIQSEKPLCSDAIGNIGLYETFYRQSKLEAWTYAGLCERGSCQNRHPAAARKVFIITPYRVNPLFYRKLAAALCKEALERGDFPVAPHLYFTQFLPDNGYGREYGITAGHELMKHCNAVEVCLVDGLITEGIGKAEKVNFSDGEIPETVEGAPVRLRQPEGWFFSEEGIWQSNVSPVKGKMQTS